MKRGQRPAENGNFCQEEKKHTNHRIEEKMNNKDVEKITLDLSFPVNSLARPNLRSFYKTITNCTHCNELHALNTKRISLKDQRPAEIGGILSRKKPQITFTMRHKNSKID